MQTGSAVDVIKTNEQLVASLGVDIESGPDRRRTGRRSRTPPPP